MWLVGIVATVALTLLLARDLFVDQPGFDGSTCERVPRRRTDHRDCDSRGPSGRGRGTLRDEHDFRDAVDARFERVDFRSPRWCSGSWRCSRRSACAMLPEADGPRRAAL
jgi:hypothetical protein